jgi:hypothetical protein
MFPLFGILFLIALSDIFVGLVSLCFKRTRVFAAYLLLCLLFGTFLSFWLFWGGGFFGRVRFWPYTLENFGASSATLVVSRLEHLLVFTSRGKSIDDYSPNKTPQPTGIH